MSFGDVISHLIFGTPYAGKRMSHFMPGQQRLSDKMFDNLQSGGIYGQGGDAYGKGMDYLSDLFSGKGESFDKLAAPYQRKFSEQTVPDLSARFSGMGYGGVNSSGFNAAMGQAGERVNENLASMFEKLKSQNLGNLQGLAGMPFDQAKSGLDIKGFSQPFIPPGKGLLGGAAESAGDAFGGPLILKLLKAFGLFS
jgi:hypothetical protein